MNSVFSLSRHRGHGEDTVPQLPAMFQEYRVDLMVSPRSFARAQPTIQTDAIPASCGGESVGGVVESSANYDGVKTLPLRLHILCVVQQNDRDILMQVRIEP